MAKEEERPCRNGITYGAGKEARRQFLTATILLIVAGAAIVLALVYSADLKSSQRLLSRSAHSTVHLRQQTQKLWFSPGIDDQMARDVRIATHMSPRINDLISAGLSGQAKMAHLDFFHSHEAEMAARCLHYVCVFV
jgi:hypothetical protein